MNRAEPLEALSQFPTRMHPLAVEAYNRYFAEPKGFEDGELDCLCTGMDALAADPVMLWAAIGSLGLLSMLLEHEGDRPAADAIRRITGRKAEHLAPYAAQIAEALGVDPDQADARSLVERQMELISSNFSKRAAFHGEAAPEGSFQVSGLRPDLMGSREIRANRAPALPQETAGPGRGKTAKKPRAVSSARRRRFTTC